MLDTRALYKSKKKLRNTREQCRTIILFLLHLQNLRKVKLKPQKESDLDNFTLWLETMVKPRKMLTEAGVLKVFPMV